MPSLWFAGPLATELLAIAMVACAVTAMGQQITHVFGGLHPLILHATVMGVLAGGALCLIARARRAWLIWLGSPLLGAILWTGSSLMCVGASLSPATLLGVSLAVGALAGLIAAPLPHAIWRARMSSAGDALRDARTRIGAWSALAGAILIITSVTPSRLPAITLALGLITVALGVEADLRALAWLRRVRAGREPGWAVVSALPVDFELPTLWYGDDPADQVVCEQLEASGAVYRATPQSRRIGRVSEAQIPRAVESRVRIALATTLLSVLLVTGALLLK